MATEGTEAVPTRPGDAGSRRSKTHRRILFGTIASLVVAVTVVGSVLLLARTSTIATIATQPSMTPLASAATAVPSAAGPAGSAATATPATPSVAPATPSAVPTPLPTPTVQEYFVANGTEPTIAADPFSPGVLAVATQNVFMSSPTAGCSVPTIRVSRDGGATWSAAIYPWAHRCQDMHVIVAWGPDSRLWAGDAVGVGNGNVSMSVTYSDDMGKSWSKPFVERFTRPWVGCYPSIAVDNWPGSPNFGTVYVAYNWLPDRYGPGVAVMASRDGTAWVHTEVSLDSLPGYPFSWRIGYRIAAAPNGTAFVSFYQSSLKSWSTDNLLWEGPNSNIGRLGFEVALVHFDGATLSADRPAWVTSVDQTAAQWQSGLAVDDSGRAWLAVESNGGVSVGRLDGAWTAFSIPGQSSYKASLAISGRIVFVGWHATDATNRVWTYYSLSYDAGATFLPPSLVTGAKWSLGWATGPNGVGLRENADFQGGVVYYAYGDARSGDAVYMAQIHP